MNKEEISIVLSGEAGQGIKTVETLLTVILRDEGYHFFSTSEAMSRIRGGNNTTEIRIGKDSIGSYSDKIDLLFVLNADALDRIKHRITENTIIIADSKFIPDEIKAKSNFQAISVNLLAREIGNEILSNIVTLGLILGILDINDEVGINLLKKKFDSKGEFLINQNISALHKGFSTGKEFTVHYEFPTYPENKKKAIINGSEAIGIGALAGGCNFIGSYPMSPGTAVLTFMAHRAEEFGVVVEQAEDEISAINMCLGAWYAGARAMVTTSGGGFALMTEGVSLAGIAELPAVIHIAQRPGPGTGLPTRTEQGDLDLALYAGHGEFPRIIYAPGNNEDAISLAFQAFNIAEKYRIPVFLLTDAYLVDSIQLTAEPDFTKMKVEKQFVKTSNEFKTYAISENGISPRGIPSYGDGFVCIDSDEHDEYGHITEDFDVRIQQMNKRMSKHQMIKDEAIAHELIGDPNAETIIVGWGSTYGVLKEAMKTNTKKSIAFAYFKQVFPLAEESIKLIKKAKKIIVIENNFVGQFANLLQRETERPIKDRITKYSGEPFKVEEIISIINNI